MYTYGTVKWFNNAKGFGFIQPEDGGADVFAHFSSIQMDGFRTLRPGARVRFELLQGEKGAQAQHIEVVATNDNEVQANASASMSHSSS